MELEYPYGAAENAMILDGLNHCIIGLDHLGYIAYSLQKLESHFVSEGMSREEAVEWIDFNIVGLNGNFYLINEHKENESSDI